MSKPAIFVSSTGDLRSARDIVAKVLISLGYEPIWQDIEATDGGELLQILRKRIKPCQIVVQLVGHRYGEEPPMPPDKMIRCSYTQYEGLYAEAIGKKVIYIWLPPEFPTDAAPPEPPERTKLQLAYRDLLKSRNVLRQEVVIRESKEATHESLENKILKLRDELEAAREAFERRNRRLLMVSGVGLVFSVMVLMLVWSQWNYVHSIVNEPSWITAALEEAGVDRSEITKDDFELSVRAYSLTGPNQGRVDVKVSDKIKPIFSNGGIEVRAGKGVWHIVYTDTMFSGYFAILTSDDLDAGPPLQVRIDSQVGFGVGDVIGPFLYDIDAGQIIRARQQEAINDPNNKWLSYQSGALKVDSDYFRDNADALSAVHFGTNPDRLTRKSLPMKPGESASFKENIQYMTEVSFFGTQLQMQMQIQMRRELAEGFPNVPVFTRLEKSDGTLMPLIKNEGMTVNGD